MNELLSLLSNYTYDSTDERIFQDGIERVLKEFTSEYSREMTLGDCGTIDFVVRGTGIEAKIKGNRHAVLRQIARYLESDYINGLILISAKRSLVAGIPATLNGKPVAALYVGRAF